MKESIDSLHGAVRAGLEQIERGEYEEYDERTTRNLAKDIKTRGRRKLGAKAKGA